MPTPTQSIGDQPAYPAHPETVIEGHIVAGSNGMTLRQHYAGLAMQGMLAGPPGSSGGVQIKMWDDYARVSVGLADALLAALAQTAPVPTLDPRIAKCEALLALIQDPRSGCTMTGFEAFTVMRSKLRAAMQAGGGE